MGQEARAFQRKDKILGGLVAPLLEAGRGLDAVERAVDLDRRDMPAGVSQLFRLAQARRVEGAAPRWEDPAADADPYGAAVFHRSRAVFPAQAGTHFRHG